MNNIRIVICFIAVFTSSLLAGQVEQFEIKHLSINTEQADFGTSYYKDLVVYVSTKEGVRSIKRTWSGNHLPFLDMYVANLEETNELSDRRQFRNFVVNKKYHDGPAAFSKDGNLMVFTRNNYEEKSSDDVVKLQLFYSTQKGDIWSVPEGIHFNSKEYSVGQPSLTADGKIMYFASDMDGGKGGVDIWKVNRNNDGTWGSPVNMGDKINTSGKEMFPFIHESGMLFFSSTSHESLGGLDVLVCDMSNGEVGMIKHLDAPLNGPSDDFALVLNEKMERGFFSSNREGGKGDDDIYSFDMRKPITFGKTIEGIAKDKDGNPLEGVNVILVDEGGKEIQTIASNADGSYSFAVDPDKKFKLKGNLDKYFDGSNLASTFGNEPVVEADLILEKDPGFSMYCIVTENGAGTPIEGVKVTVTDNLTDTKEDFVTTGAGDFRRLLEGKKINDRISYNFRFEKQGYLVKTVTYNKLLDKPGQYNVHEDLDINLDKIDVGTDIGKLIDIKPIYFDVNKDIIRRDAAAELDKIVQVLNDNPTLEIELASHTDCRASKSYNQKLSDRRAKSSAKYVKDKITNPDRIFGKGYGESTLVNKCECEGSKKVPCTEDEHQANRRTEFTIVKM